jgi:hypothetical protein
MTSFGRRPLPPLHASRHESSGVDEISIASLSGEVADNQPVLAHDLAGADHDADTLADLNLKVSDATLDDAGDPRDPNAHNSSHQDGGSDEIVLTDLAGKSLFVDRGDPDAWDWTLSSFTTDGNWNDLDCSGIVPAGATAIRFRVNIKDDLAESYFSLRKNGLSNAYNTVTAYNQLANIALITTLQTFCDAGRIIEYATTVRTYTNIDMVVLGWFIG